MRGAVCLSRKDVGPFAQTAPSAVRLSVLTSITGLLVRRADPRAPRPAGWLPQHVAARGGIRRHRGTGEVVNDGRRVLIILPAERGGRTALRPARDPAATALRGHPRGRQRLGGQHRRGGPGGRLVTRTELTDTTSGFRACNRPLIELFARWYPRGVPPGDVRRDRPVLPDGAGAHPDRRRPRRMRRGRRTGAPEGGTADRGGPRRGPRRARPLRRADRRQAVPGRPGAGRRTRRGPHRHGPVLPDPGRTGRHRPVHRVRLPARGRRRSADRSSPCWSRCARPGPRRDPAGPSPHGLRLLGGDRRAGLVPPTWCSTAGSGPAS